MVSAGRISRGERRIRRRRWLRKKIATSGSVSGARTDLDGVIFLALASDLSALRVALRPFASRYASTDGTRSAAFAVATGVTACMVVDAESSAPQSEEEPGATIGAKRSLVVEFFASAVVRWFGGVLTNHVDGKVWIGLAITWKQ